MVGRISSRRRARLAGLAAAIACLAGAGYAAAGAFSLAATDAIATANVAQIQGTLRPARDTLAALIGRMTRQAHRPGGVRLNSRQLLATIGKLEGAEVKATERFPAVFGRAYAQTSSQLQCMDSRMAMSQAVLSELAQRRFWGPGVTRYALDTAAAQVNRARTCAATLARMLGGARGVSSQLASRLNALRRLLGKMARSSRTVAAQLTGADMLLLGVEGQFPGVFGLPYRRTFAPLACLESQWTLARGVLRQFEQRRLKPESGNPAAYAFRAVLGDLRRASSCEASLMTTLGLPGSASGQPAAGGATAAPAGATASTQPSPSSSATPIYMDTHYSFAERAADLVSRMTLAEKVAQLRTDNAPAIPRLGVQQYTYWNEGQHGVNALGADTNSGGVSGGPQATSFPTNFAATMSWDPKLVYDETTAVSDEIRGFLDKSLWGAGQNNLGPSSTDYGSLTFWAPTVNMDRDPRWGRSDEAFGEDPYLVSQMAGAFVDGYQGQSLEGQPQTPYLKVAATAKHYALNDIEDNRQASSSNVDDATLHDYYTAQFRSLIEDSHVSGLMTSLNAINGTPAMVDTYTNNQVAQRTYGFGGYTTSDCALSNVYRTSPNGHNWAPPGWSTDGQDQNASWTNSATGTSVSGAAGAQAYALRGGTDLNCPGSQATLANVQRAIDAGILSEGVIDNALARLFTTRMETGEFDPRSQVPYTGIGKDVIQSPAHQALAEKVAANSLVLLKNDAVSGTSSSLLPVNPTTVKKVVILGNLADKVTLGGYSGNPSLRVSPHQGIIDALQAQGAQVVYDGAGTCTTCTSSVALSAQTQTDIKSADLVLVFAGTDAAVAGEGHDRTTLAMPGNYNSLIDQVAAVGNARMALVIQSDGPVSIASEQSKFPAILFSGYNGESQGDALADVIFGKQDPSGHLDFTWYADDSQLPPMSNYGLSAGATGGLGRTYMYFTGTPTYPFGYGLSYTQFQFSGLQVDANQITADGSVKASFTVKNVGSTPGAAVAQLYVGTPSTLGAGLPAERLEAFKKTDVLNPGVTQAITLTVPAANLAFWDAQQAKWVVHGGAYPFQLATDAGHVVSAQTVNVIGGVTPHVKYVTVQPESLVYRPGDTLDLTARNRWIADDTDPAQEQRNLGVTADHVVEAVNDDGSFVDLAQAPVSYRSSNDNVATVSSTGIMKAVSPGVATISATVGGVTGSAVVVVKRPLTLVAPPVAQPGSSFLATETFLNTGSTAVSGVKLELAPPSGWTATPGSSPSWASVPPGGSAQVTWTVTPSVSAEPGSYRLEARASTQGGDEVEVSTAQVALPYQSLGAAFDDPGISDDTNPGAGNLDGQGRSYSAQALSSAGLSPGVTVSHDGLSFTWPAASAGTPDNVTANGQAIALAGSGTRLGFLGAGDFGSASGTGTIVYSDGSIQLFSLTFADWWANKAVGGGDIVATMPYVNVATGQRQQSNSVYYASVPLAAGKTVRYVILPPDVSQGGASGHTTMHVFSTAIG